MKSTAYLNFILTVIAFFLFAITLLQSGIIPKAYASPQATEVDVNLREIGGYAIHGGMLRISIADEVKMRCTDCK